MPLTIKEAVEWVRANIGFPSQAEVISTKDIIRYLDVGLKKVITLLSTFTDEIFPMTNRSLVLSANMGVISLNFDFLRIKSVLINDRYALKRDLNYLFEKKTYKQDEKDYIYAFEGSRRIHIYPVPNTSFTITFYYILKPPDLPTISENFDLENFLPPYALDLVVKYASAECFLKLKDGNGYSVCMRIFYDGITLLQQSLSISPPPGSRHPHIPQQAQ